MATLSIEVPNEAVAEIRAAYGHRLRTETDGVARIATVEEIRQFLIREIKSAVREYRADQAKLQQDVNVT